MTQTKSESDAQRVYDAIVIGSGFGGSVAALRLAEKGHQVLVLEQGRRIERDDMLRAQTSLRDLVWAPELGARGFFSQRVLEHVGIVSGIGVGGGSLVYAAVLLEPKAPFYADPVWQAVGIDASRELTPFYQTAASMLGVVQNPYRGKMDEWLEASAQKLDAHVSFGPVPQGIYFGKRGEAARDPFFHGQGPDRRGCTLCGQCLTGCPERAKNSLDLNYLHLAQTLGANIVAERKVTSIRPLERGYEVTAVNPLDRSLGSEVFLAERVFIAAGVLGTTELLLKCRDEQKTLPKLSRRLGEHVRTNGEAIVGILSEDQNLDLSEGTTISSHFYFGPHTHITQNRFPRGYSFMRFYMGPLVDGRHRILRALKTLLLLLTSPIRQLRAWRKRSWDRRISVLTVMQSLESKLTLSLGRSRFTAFRRGLVSKLPKGEVPPPSYLPEANLAARAFAEASGGTPHNVLPESLLGMSVTAHILGGAVIGRDAEHGVVNAQHEAFHYPGLYVVDGSVLPVNVGVNPSLTITAMAERALSFIPTKTR